MRELDVLVCLGALAFLMFVAYRGFSVVLFAPVAALGAVLLTMPGAVLPVYSGLFMDSMVAYFKNYFPVFLLGALFGKLVESSGFSTSIVSSVMRVLGPARGMLSIVVVCGLLTYGGVSMFVVVFAVYPFAREIFRQADIPKRLIPGAIALGGFTLTMDSLPGSPQIQNIIPTTFFKTTAMAGPWLGTIGGCFVLVIGLIYLESRRRSASRAGEGYGIHVISEAGETHTGKLYHPAVAALPLVVVWVSNFWFTRIFPVWFGVKSEVHLTATGKPIVQQVSSFLAIWSVEAALTLGILTIVLLAFRPVAKKMAEGSRAAVGGALLAAGNTASEFGFGSVIAALPGFLVIRDALKLIPDPLINEAVTVNALAGVTGSASGGVSIALAAMADQFLAAGAAAHIPPEVLHRVASMASGGMDTLPHNGAIITLLAVTGLTHRESYRDIFALTIIKTCAVFLVIGVYYLTGLV